MERRPLLWVAAAAVSGAALVQPLSFDLRCVVFVCAAGIVVAALQRTTHAWVRLAAVAALVAGATSGWLHQHLQPAIAESRTERFACTVVGDVQTQAGFTSFACELDGGPVVLVETGDSPPALATHALLRGRIEPFDEARNPGEPSERAIESERGIVARVAAAHVLRTLSPAPLTPRIVLARMHAWALARLRERLLEPASSVLTGELWGERGTLPPDLRAEFQETGTVHVLVTAGLHLGVVVAMLLALLRVLRVPRIAACGAAAAAIWAYAAFSGLHLPSLRAATMITVALGARAYGAKALGGNAIAVALILFAITDPLSVTSASFVLSFSCVGAIAVTGDLLGHALEAIVALPERVREALTLTIATQLGTWPLTASIFLIVTPYAILANLCVVPAVGFTMLLGAAEFAASWIPPVAQAFANLDGWLLAWMLASVRVVASLPESAVPVSPPPVLAIVAYDAAVLAGALLWRRGARALALSLLAVACTLIVSPPRFGADRMLRITVLDVGQADSIVIQTPGGHALLVDGGGRLERGSQNGDSSAERVGERIVVPFLLRHGITQLDALVISHPHGDHVAGCAPVLRELRVAEIADSGQTYNGHAYHDCLDTARADRVAIVYPRAGMVWRTTDGVTLTFIGPSLPFIGGKNAINDNSVAFVLQYEQFRMLFTGDAGVAAERRFLGENVDLHADVLKVGHHGSAYSSSPAFIAAVHPRYAIISVGRHNLFGHPAASTLETLTRSGTAVYRTDEDGAVTVTVHGSAVTVQQFIGPTSPAPSMPAV